MNSNETVTLTATITDKDILDIPFCTGANYWADVHKVNYAGQFGLNVYLVEDYESNPRTVSKYPTFVSKSDLLDAFSRIISNRDKNGDPYALDKGYREQMVKAIINGEDGKIDIGDIDPDIAEVWLQIAIWDYVIYG